MARPRPTLRAAWLAGAGLGLLGALEAEAQGARDLRGASPRFGSGDPRGAGGRGGAGGGGGKGLVFFPFLERTG